MSTFGVLGRSVLSRFVATFSLVTDGGSSTSGTGDGME